MNDESTYQRLYRYSEALRILENLADSNGDTTAAMVARAALESDDALEDVVTACWPEDSGVLWAKYARWKKSS